MSKPKVLITGISGYIGSHVCKTFLEHGGFEVRGTVRNKSNPKKIEPLQRGFGDELFKKLDIVEADLTNAESIDKAVAGCQYIVHTAAPVFDFTKVLDNEDEILKLNEEGTLAVMKAAQKHKVKKVIITSSIAAIVGGNNKTTYTEDDWSNLEVEGVSTYFKAKTLGEKAAWDFVDALEEKEKFAVATINPSIVLGPNITTAFSESIDFGKQMLMGEIPMCPKKDIAFVDVRDVSKAHLEAVLRDDANGKRFILCAKNVMLFDLVKAMEEKFCDKYPVKAKELPWIVPFIMRLWDKQMAELYEGWGKVTVFNGSRATEVLGIEYIGYEKSMQDMGEALVETGYVEKK